MNCLGTIKVNILNKEIPSLNTLRKYLDEMTKIILSLNLWVFWTTPTGVTVNLSTLKNE